MSTLIQRSFASGEIAPALYARCDQSKYGTGLRTILNAYVMRHGGATNRPGTKYVCEVKDSSKAVRLIPFVFSTAQTYVLEFGNLYLRIIKNGVQQTLTAQAITGITNANPGVLTYGGADNYANGEEVVVSGIIGPIGDYLNGRNFLVAGLNAGANTFQLNYLDGTPVNTTAMGAYTSGGTIAKVYTVTTTYTEAELPEIKFIQSADIVTITHPSHKPAELARTGDTSWTLTDYDFELPEGPNVPDVTNVGTPGSTTYIYRVTAFEVETGIESRALGNSTVTGNAVLNTTNYNVIEFTALGAGYAGEYQYNVYRELNGIFGLIGIAGETGFFSDIGYDADTTITPPTERDPFNATDEYPSCATYFQQRLYFANTNNDPETIEGSRIGDFKNFTSSTPLRDDDSIKFKIAGRQVNEVHHLLDLGSLVIFTESGEWSAQGGTSGSITPTDINTKQYSYNGASSRLAPIVIGNTAIYVQARGSIVRDLGFDYQVDGYNGNDLSVFSSHLFEEYTLLDWSYQKVPHSIVWIVRDDGTMLGLTYLREQALLAWHRHEFEDASVENVCCIPEGNEDTLYLTINRTIGGATKRYIEKFTTRQVIDIVDAKFMDSNLSYDGRNTGSQTMTLSGSGWTYEDELTVTSSVSQFTSADVGKEIHFEDAAGDKIRFLLTGYTSATVMTGKPHKTVPVALRAAATTNWGLAVKTVKGLWHLEGKAVSIFGDGFVVANPNNSAYEMQMVTNGMITLDEAYVVLHVGLPFTTDIETLNIDTAQGETIADKKNIVQAVTVFVEKTRGIWIGPKPPPDEDDDFLGGLVEVKARGLEGYDEPVDLATGTFTQAIRSEWKSNGRLFIRQTDPCPFTLLAIAPAGYFPFRGGN